MSVLNRAESPQSWPVELSAWTDAKKSKAEIPSIHRRPFGLTSALFESCSNPDCDSGFLHLWRKRTSPVFEDGWTCSPDCTAARIRTAVRRELETRSRRLEGHRHRIPLGLLMLEKGWITQAQLRAALDAQKSAGTGRLGQWLIRHGAVTGLEVTRALSLQWSCPVLPIEFHEPALVAGIMPRLFVDAFGALPLRVAGGKILYLGFEESLDPALALAVERMTGLRVESGIVQESLFRPAHARMLAATFPPVELIEADSDGTATHALSRSVERYRPAASRLVRVHDCLWLRMWMRLSEGALEGKDTVKDVVCRIGIS